MPAPPDKAGRKTDYHPAIGAAIVKIVRAGNYMNTACGICRVPGTTLRKWVAKGREDLAKGKDTPRGRFAAALTRAKDLSERDLVAKVRAAAEGITVQRIRKVTKPVIKDGVIQVHCDAAGNPVMGPDGKVQVMEYTETHVDVTPNEQDWRAGAFLLAARWSGKYNKQRIRVDGTLAHKHRHEIAPMTPEDRAIATRIAVHRLPQLPAGGGGNGSA